MQMEIIDQVTSKFEEYIEKETEMLALGRDGFLPIKIEQDNFYSLPSFTKEKELIAIDGGNQEILASANFSLNFIRIVGFGKKIIKKEFFCLVTCNENYNVQIYGDNLFSGKLTIEKNIKTVNGEKYEIEIGSVANFVRRYSELILAKELVSEGVNVVLDGSLKVRTKYEFELVKDLIDKANNSVIGFLSKTSRMLTKNGNSLNVSLMEVGPKTSWYYYPVFKITDKHYLGEMSFVKLNEKSNHVFKLESNKIDKDFVLQLALNSKDAVFFGYPYNLVQADIHARVSNKEIEYLKTIFVSKVKNKTRLKYLLSTMDAHSILDNIS